MLLLLLGATPLLARPVEPVAYATLQRSVEAATHAQTIPEARAFLRQFPQSSERQQVSFWLAEALYATQAYQDAVPVYRALLHETPTFPQAATALHHLGLSYLYSRRLNAALATFAYLLEQYPGVEDREQVLLHMATIYFEQGRFDEAVSYTHLTLPTKA